MKHIINKIKKYGLDYPKTIIWLVRLKRVDPNAKDELFSEWIIRLHEMGDVEEKSIFWNCLISGANVRSTVTKENWLKESKNF